MSRIARVRDDILRSDWNSVEISSALLTEIDETKCDMFGRSLCAFLLYAQCVDGQHRAPGLYLRDGNASFALGLYEYRGCPAVHLICPAGHGWESLVTRFSEWLLRELSVPYVYVRHLAERQAAALESHGFLDGRIHPWIEEAPFEDETFNHRIVHADQLMRWNGRLYQLNDIDGDGSKNFKRKFRLAHARFSNFLQHNSARFELRDMRSADRTHAWQIVRAHFEFLEARRTPIGSTADDYRLVLESIPLDTQATIAVVGWLSIGPKEIASSVFLGESIGARNGAFYLTITRRSQEVLGELGIANGRGFSAIAQYAFADALAIARRRGWEVVDLGGSETKDLDRFKRQMGARLQHSCWVVATSGSRLTVGPQRTDSASTASVAGQVQVVGASPRSNESATET